MSANPAKDPIIRIDALKKVFHTDEVETHAVADVHIEIPRGQYVCIAGPSGSGKSTLLSIIGLLDTPTSGTYELDGQAVSGLSGSERARVRNERIGFIFQTFNLIGDLTVAENVELPLTYRGMSAAERRRPGRRRARAGRHGPPRAAPARPALGRSAAARRGRAGGGRRAARSCSPTSRPATSTRRTARR